ncbi:MAG: chromosome segregation SMC family protein, partial [Dehalococcoidia bacterium]
MYLKRLELQGFKSFATKTLFEFGPGITAVVGPNGSGKSNVAESIRWVLGEASARDIRGRRIEDIIFSGSSQKSAVGMAEVSITMDNAEGWLPVDYAEVVVTRRAYRSGESEYLINRNKVRMRDIQDLFMRAQVGQNSYAFMGQGLVDEVLVMRPDDRRRLLEEAADVRLLRARLDEARDRLSATRENLERVNMLIEEIGPRLAQLERQAQRAIEHGRLARELHDTLRELYGTQWKIALAALTAARSAFDQRRQELDVVQQETKACEDGLAALIPAIAERQRDLGARRARRRVLSDEVHALEQRLALARERREGQARRRVELEAELVSIRDERTDLQRSIAKDQERALAVVPEIEDAKTLIATRRQELNALEQEQAGLRRRITDAEDVVSRARRGIQEAANALRRLAEEEQRAQADIGRRSGRKQEVIDLFVRLRSEGRDLRDRLFDLEREIDSTEQQRISLNAMVESSRNDLRTLENEGLQAESRLNQLQARQELLIRLQNAQEGVDSGARYLIGDENEDNVAEGLIGLVRDIVRVPPGLELAIEAALAENLSA